jgi:dUTP pyrophosphatase
MKLKVKKLHPDAVIPKYAKPGDAGLDLTAVFKEWSADGTQVIYNIGLSFEIPDNHVGLIFPRSSIYKTDLFLSNSVGVIDSKFRGEVKAIFNYKGNDASNVYNVGDRIAQLVIIPYPQIELVESDELSETERGTGGFGHSGK